MNTQSIQKERVVVLLRASSKQQTDREHDFDIPQQKSILLPFVDSQGWELVKVFTEGGVSGFKVSANNRDAIQDIKKMADNREFDRLVIYMSDRLGRIADETPLIVSYLNQRGLLYRRRNQCERPHQQAHNLYPLLASRRRKQKNITESVGCYYASGITRAF